MPPGRPKEITPKPVEYPKLTSAQIAQIAPLNKNGLPDLMNYMPTRLIPFAEAQARGWIYFYDGSACRRHHVAPRFVSNKDQCVDCRRVERGKQPIGRAAGEPPRQTYVRDGKHSASPSVVTPTEPQPDRLEKQFLLSYAANKDFDHSANIVGVTPAIIRARMSWSSVFRLAVAEVENQCNIVHVPPASSEFEWDEDKYFRFCEVLIDTGLAEVARESIGARHSEVLRELERNPEFSLRVAKAEDAGNKIIEEKAYKLALEGNDALLRKILTAKMPRVYGESVKLDVKIEERLTDEQLRHEIVRLYTQRRGRVIEGECDSDDSGRPTLTGPDATPAAPAVPDGERAEPASGTESYLDLL